mmetsp:Transcript_58437/g.163700  ORF Transcript_58437/g.163700 Transcript_58437/m.163700 type:complete len:373 (+) Transcript_58437:871-1989(+)
MPPSSMSACATMSSNVGPRPSLCLAPSPSSASWATPRNSSNFSSESGKTTARALHRAVPLFMKLPTAKPVLAHRRTRSDVFNAWQHPTTFSVAFLRSANSRAGPTSNAPQASFPELSAMELRTQRYRSGVSSCAMSCGPMSICRSCSTASFCSHAAVYKLCTPSGGKHSGKSSKVRRVLATRSGGGSLLKVMAKSCEDFSSKMRSRFLGSSACPGRRWGGALSAADPAARGCDKAKCFSSACASKGAGAWSSSKRLPSGTWFTAVQNSGRNFGPVKAGASAAPGLLSPGGPPAPGRAGGTFGGGGAFPRGGPPGDPPFPGGPGGTPFPFPVGGRKAGTGGCDIAPTGALPSGGAVRGGGGLGRRPLQARLLA